MRHWSSSGHHNKLIIGEPKRAVRTWCSSNRFIIMVLALLRLVQEKKKRETSTFPSAKCQHFGSVLCAGGATVGHPLMGCFGRYDLLQINLWRLKTRKGIDELYIDFIPSKLRPHCRAPIHALTPPSLPLSLSLPSTTINFSLHTIPFPPPAILFIHDTGNLIRRTIGWEYSQHMFDQVCVHSTWLSQRELSLWL